MKKYLLKAVKIAGSQSELARRLGVRQSTLWCWMYRNRKPFPAEYCAKLEKATDGIVKKSDVRPDLPW